MVERPFVGLGVEGGYTVSGHLHLIVAIAGVGCGVQHADVGATPQMIILSISSS